MFYRGFCRPIIVVLTTALILLLWSSQVVAEVPTGYQEYYVLGNEEHAWQAFLEIYDGSDSNIPGNICSTVSLVATSDYQVVYYDHWEDGYESDLLHPTQSSTEVYTLTIGTTLSLTSTSNTGALKNRYIQVSSGRNPSDIRYDSGDRLITSGGPVALTHAIWPYDNPWVGGAWEIYSRQAYDGMYDYSIPVGEDLYDFGRNNNGKYGDFRNVIVQLSAFTDDTIISIDNGTGQVIDITLDRGKAYSSLGYIQSQSAPTITINAGTVIRTNKPIQLGLMTGAGSSDGFQGRFFVMLPNQEWGADYVVPIPRGFSTDVNRVVPAEVYLFNPNDFPITVNAYDQAIQTSFTISPSGNISATVPYSYQRGSQIPQDSAARFTSADGNFGIVVAADTSKPAYDWGFTSIPVKYLTKDYYVAWAPGTTDLTDNGSPVWVTPAADETTFYVDYSPLDNIVDRTFTLNTLEQERIFDPDLDNSGMHIWATEAFAIAWGEDPGTAGDSTPYFDLGVSILPLQQRWLDPILGLTKSANPTILPEAGGIVTFTLNTQAFQAPVTNVGITDTLPISWTYVASSAAIVYPDGTQSQVEPTKNGQILYWDTATKLDIEEHLTLTFQAQITNTTGITTSTNYAEAIGKHEFSGAYFTPRDEAIVYLNPLNLTKTVNYATAKVGQTLVYTLSYENRGSLPATNVMIQDIIPIQYITLESVSSGGIYNPTSSTLEWTFSALNPGNSGIVTFTAKVNSFVEDGTPINNAGYIQSDQTTRARSNIAQTLILAPKVSLEKAGPTIANQGDIITYTLTYKNSGKTNATGVIISDSLPISVTYIAGSLAIMTDTTWLPLSDAPDGDIGSVVASRVMVSPNVVQANTQGKIRYSVRIHPVLPSGARIFNSATLDRDLDIPRNSNLVATRITDLLIEKSVEPKIAAPNEVLTYTLKYANDSTSVSQTDVTILEAIPDYTDFVLGSASGSDQITYSWDYGMTWSTTQPITPITHLRWYDAVLPPDTQLTVTFSVKVRSVLPERTTIQNTAYISSTETGLFIRELLPSNQVSIPTIDLWIEKIASAPNANAGETVAYTLTYGNYGSADATGVQISDNLPIGTHYSAGSIWGIGANDTQAPTLTWNIGTIPSGVSAQQVGYALTLDPALLPNQRITNTATISNAQTTQTSPPSVLTITRSADLAINKHQTPSFAAPESTLTYTLTFTNYGPSDAYNITLIDQMPQDMVFGEMVDSAGFFGPTQTGQLLTWYTPTLPANTSGTLVFTTIIKPDSNNTFSNTASITADTQDPNPTNNTDTIATNMLSTLDLILAKSQTPLFVAPGEMLTYTLNFANNSGVDAPNVIITDTLPSDITINQIVHSNPTFTYTHMAPRYVWQIGDLSAGETGTITLTGIVATGLSAGYTFTNIATIASTAADDIPLNNTSQSVASVINAAPIANDDTLVVLEENITTTLAGGQISVLHNDYDLNGDDLYVTITPITQVTAGLLSLNENGNFTYTHSNSENHLDGFVYEVCDSGMPQLCDTATVVITIIPVNDPPIASDDAISIAEGSTTSVLTSGNVSVLANDTDPDLPPDTLSTTLSIDATYGTLTLNADGTFSYTHDGSENFLDSFTYQACDNGTPQYCSTARVHISVTPINDPPTITTPSDVRIVVNTTPPTQTLHIGDAESSPDALTLTVSTSNPTLIDTGQIRIDGSGTSRTLILTPTAGILGSSTITITVSDGEANTQVTFSFVVSDWLRIYLPLVTRKYILGPDLIVQDLLVSANDIQVVIKNQGQLEVPKGELGFWIDVYIDPDVPPTRVNQTYTTVGEYGLVWGVNLDSLPMAPGETITLTIRDRYYNENHSSDVPWPLEAGIWVYAQVDSVNGETNYGGILENHEIAGGTYNNIIGVQFTGLHTHLPKPNNVLKPSSPADEELLKQLPPRP